MIVTRTTFKVKKKCMDALIDHIKAGQEFGLPMPPHGYRIYSTAMWSPWDIVMFEAEFQSEEEQATYWAEWFAAPGSVEWTEKSDELCRAGGRNEAWDVETILPE